MKLELSAGKLGEQTVYRPYSLVASLLGQAINTTHVNISKGAASGATFRDADKSIAEWSREQARLDSSLGLTLPLEPGAGVPLSKGSVSVKTFTDWS